jgi:hypothetical protein
MQTGLDLAGLHAAENYEESEAVVLITAERE